MVKPVDDYGMMIGHSTGTTGKLSFIPRSLVEWPTWKAPYNDTTRASSGVDPTKDFSQPFFQDTAVATCRFIEWRARLGLTSPDTIISSTPGSVAEKCDSDQPDDAFELDDTCTERR